jgi:hypothetical protein
MNPDAVIDMATHAPTQHSIRRRLLAIATMLGGALAAELVIHLGATAALTAATAVLGSRDRRRGHSARKPAAWWSVGRAQPASGQIMVGNDVFR